MRPAKPETIRARIAYYVNEFTRANLTCSKGQRGAVQKYICMIWQTPATRHLCTWWIMGGKQEVPQLRMNQLSAGEILALSKWINAQPDATGLWLADPALEQEAEWVRWAAEREEEQRSHQLPLGDAERT